MDHINYITPITFGRGAITALDGELTRLDISRPLVITDKGIASAGILDRALAACGKRQHALFDGTAENPSEANMREALAIFGAAGCDGIIAIGGGSPMDLAKAVALIATQGGSFADYDVKVGGSEKIKRVLPHIAIPTAAGTGAEIGRACVLTTDDGRKTVAVNLAMVAHGILCDPDLALSLPPMLTAATGMDALSHGIETYCSPRHNPPAAAIALDCVAGIAGNIERATAHGDDIEARSAMLMGALEGGMVLQKGLGSAHAMANPLGELNLHHGTLIAILLPHVVAFNADAVPEKMRTLREVIGMGMGADGSAGENLAVWIKNLTLRLGLPQSLKEIGVAEAVLEEMAAKAVKDHLSATNPRPAGIGDYRTLLRRAWEGVLQGG